MGPLSGIKVIELQGIGPGPFCGMMLADMGAQIVRIDRAASVGAPANPSDVLARGRQSIAVDLKNPEGVETVPRWLGAGLAAGLLLWAAWLLVLRFRLAQVPVAVAAMAVLDTLGEGILRAYPGAFAGAVVAAALTLTLSVYWFGRLTADTAATAG